MNRARSDWKLAGEALTQFCFILALMAVSTLAVLGRPLVALWSTMRGAGDAVRRRVTKRRELRSLTEERGSHD